MGTVRKIATAVLLMGAILSLQMGAELWQPVICILMALLLWPKGSREEKNCQKMTSEQEKPVALKKAIEDFCYIKTAANEMPDKELGALLRKLQSTSSKMIDYLHKHPDRIPMANQFIDYYQDRTATLIKQYLSIKGTGVQAKDISVLEQDMKDTFRGFSVAYEREFQKVMEHEVLDMNAEMKVAKQMMQQSGIDWQKQDLQNLSGDENVDAPSEEKKDNSGWDMKYVGLALGAAVLGAIGLYKTFDKEGMNGGREIDN